MKYIVLLIMIFVWWIVILIGVNFLISDTVLQTGGVEGEANLSALDIDTINFSAETVGTDTGISNIKTALKFLFGFSLTENVFGVPDFIRNILSIINWIIAILTIITILKVANIIHSG